MRLGHWAAVAACLGTFLTAANGAETAAPRKLTFQDAVARALEEGPEVKVSSEGLVASKERVDAVKAQRLPRLRAEANVFAWNKPLEIAFGAPAMMGEPPQSITMRDQVTSAVTLTLAQPLSGLFVIGRLIDLETAGKNAASADHERARLDASYRAAEAYLRALQAAAFRDVAESSQKQVEAQLLRAKVLEQGGVLGRVDILRLETAHSAARQGALKARSGVEVATRALALTLDLPVSDRIAPVDDLPDPPPALVWKEDDARAAAEAGRPELKAAQERAVQADKASSVARAQMLPNVMGIATYQHNEGQGPFLPKDAGFAGVTLQWDVWDWGKTRHDVKEAQARARQALAGSHILRDQIAFEVERRLVDARTAWETLDVARAGSTAAEEAYRIQTVRFGQGAATTTDVIDAESEVTRARLAYANTRFDYYLALVALVRSVGQVPTLTPAAFPSTR